MVRATWMDAAELPRARRANWRRDVETRRGGRTDTGRAGNLFALNRPEPTEDAALDRVLDDAGLVGDGLRATLRHAIRSCLLLRGGRDAIAVVGPEGSGRHAVAEALHRAAAEFLGRRGPLVRLFAGLRGPGSPLHQLVSEHVACAAGGTLIVEQLEALDPTERQALAGLCDAGARQDVLVLVVMDGAAPAARPVAWPTAAVALPPLHSRGEDVPALVRHFLQDAMGPDLAATSPGALGGVVDAVVEHVAATRLVSVEALRARLRGLIFELRASAGDAAGLDGARVREALAPLQPGGGHAPIASPLDAPPLDPVLLEELAHKHGVGADVLEAQVAVVARVIASMDDTPRSYANVIERTEDIKRVAIWMLSAAESQADFRRFFGDERFMQPSKSVAWAFFNRVFKRG